MSLTKTREQIKSEMEAELRQLHPDIDFTAPHTKWALDFVTEKIFRHQEKLNVLLDELDK